MLQLPNFLLQGIAGCGWPMCWLTQLFNCCGTNGLISADVSLSDEQTDKQTKPINYCPEQSTSVANEFYDEIRSNVYAYVYVIGLTFCKSK